MATVYLAHDLKHDRNVALKVLRPELAAVLGAERFLREIQLTAQLQHPHIVTLIDSGDAGGRPGMPGPYLYYVLPYTEGESLRERLTREGQLPLDEVLRLTRAVAGALQYAHDQGVIHRDIKPENILLSRGEPVVADFGIALAAASAGRERLTETGLSLGTPAYMSPEQASAEQRLDGRSDQYSLACVVYEMLAGEPPYTGSTAQAIIAKRLSEPVPKLGTLRQVPAGVEAAVTRALAKRPADRFGSVAEFAAALERPVAPPKRFGTRRMAALLGGVAVLGGMALLAWLFRPAPPPQAMVTTQITFTGKATFPALSPDGKSVAYVSGNRALWVQRLDGGEALMLVPPVRFAFGPRWTADGRAIVVVMMPDSTELAATYMVPATGGQARKVLEDMLSFDTGPDSTTVVRVPRERHRLEVVDRSTDSVLQSILLPDSLKDITPSQWSPDRRLIAFEGFGAVWVVPAAGGESRRVTSGRNARWAPTSGALYYLDGPAGADALFRIAIDPETGAGRGKPRRLQSLPGAAGFDVRGQRLVYTIAKTTQQARAMTLGGQPRRIVDDRMLTEGTARVTGATISPDGESVAFSQVRGGEANLYVVPFNGGSPRRIETPSGMVRGPSWSPDGSRLAFTRVDSIGPSVMLTDLQTRALQRIGTLPGPSTWNGMHEVALWAANGKHLAYLGRGLHQMALVNIERQSERDILIPDSVGTGYQSVVPSPDAGTLVVSTLFRPADWGELWWVSAQGNKWRKVRGPFGESWPIAWQRDGWLYLANHRALSSDYFGTVFELWRMRGPEGTPEFVAPVPDGCNPPALSADGNRLVCVSERTESDLYLSTDFDPELQQ
jgi:serine/threonine-protein kinase